MVTVRMQRNHLPMKPTGLQPTETQDLFSCQSAQQKWTSHGPVWTKRREFLVSTCESFQGNLRNNWEGFRVTGRGPHCASRCSEPVKIAYYSPLPYLYPYVEDYFPEMTFGVSPTFMKRMLVRQFFPGHSQSEKEQAEWRKWRGSKPGPFCKSEVKDVNIIFFLFSLPHWRATKMVSGG